MFRRPHYDLVSKIILVVAGKSKTPQALKQRHERMKRNKPLNRDPPEIWNPKVDVDMANITPKRE